jgi:ATP-dependent Clp protease ATP-binding subunit ClpA
LGLPAVVCCEMFERFTEASRNAVTAAENEARALKHNYIGTEHLLLGLFYDDSTAAARILTGLDIHLDEVRTQVARIVGLGDEVTPGQIPFTPRAKKTLELSLREALSLGHNYIGTEHILLGIARENEGVASRILLDCDADADKVRDAVIRFLSQGQGRARGFKTPPISAEVVATLAKLRRDKEQAIEANDFAGAHALRLQERKLLEAAQQLEKAWEAAKAETLPRYPRQFDHQLVTLLPADPLAAIEEESARGWELVSVIPDPEGKPTSVAFFKRPTKTAEAN